MIAKRLRLDNIVSSLAFMIGGSLFALGAAVAQLGSGNATTSASIYLVGGLFFSTGGYASLLLAINSPTTGSGAEGSACGRWRWRWWSYEPMRMNWLSAFVLFAGTLAFGISLIDSFIEGLSTQQVNRLIWAPSMVGCILFLISGRLAFSALPANGSRWHPRRELGWWVAAVNQVGSLLFVVSALADFTRPATESVINVDVANWGTLTGALCFAVGGLIQLFDRPESGKSPSSGDARRPSPA